MIDLKIKKVSSKENIALPKYQSAGAACFDLAANLDATVHIKPGESTAIPTGLSFEVPAGFVMLIYSRSGHGFKSGARLVNCVGVIDSDYRGEVQVGIVVDSHGKEITVNHGDRIAQAMLMPVPTVNIIEVNELSETARGIRGFGSTGI